MTIEERIALFKPDAIVGNGRWVAMYDCRCGKRFVQWFDADSPMPIPKPACPFCEQQNYRRTCGCSADLFNAVTDYGK